MPPKSKNSDASRFAIQVPPLPHSHSEERQTGTGARAAVIVTNDVLPQVAVRVRPLLAHDRSQQSTVQTQSNGKALFLLARVDGFAAASLTLSDLTHSLDLAVTGGSRPSGSRLQLS